MVTSVRVIEQDLIHKKLGKIKSPLFYLTIQFIVGVLNSLNIFMDTFCLAKKSVLRFIFA